MKNVSMVKGENFECLALPWDSDYFGVKSARIILNGSLTEESQAIILEYCKAYEFITFSNINNAKENNQWIGKNTNAFLTDMNIQFDKYINEVSGFIDEFTEIYEAYPRNKKILVIAGNAFQYSRFFNDSALNCEKSNNIYLYWTECAFGQAGKYFIITKRENEVAGYLLFSIGKESNYATIELIAVDEKFRGLGVGKALISGIFDFAYKNRIGKIKVGTQIDNAVATRFYIACGFRYVNCNSVYHMWMNK